MMRTPLCSAALLSVAGFVLLSSSAFAQGPQDWIKRILDPAKIGVTPPPGATMNRKLTVDYLSKTDPPKEMAIYMLPDGEMAAASTHFQTTLKVEPETSGSGEFEIRRFDLRDVSGPAKGLLITLARSQFVDDKLQITMEYTPPAK